jgi:hypothetical protein
MASADEYAAWIVKNADKKGTAEFNTVAAAYADSKKNAAPAPETSLAQDAVQQGKNALGGFIRGAGSIGATFAMPFETKKENEERRNRIDTNMADLVGADPNSLLYKGFKVGGELAGTAGAGGVVANGLRAIPVVAKFAAPVIDAVSSSGMTAGGLNGARAVATRALGAGVSGGVQSAMVDPADAGTGALISAATPGVLQLAGKLGSTVYNAVKSAKPNAGKLLADALGVTEADLPTIIKHLNAAPDSIVPGSKLTFTQALETQGANTPGAKMLERVVAGGPGGDALLTRYAEQGAARMDALKAQGAETYQGAARDQSVSAGNKIAAILRTQAGDDQAAARTAWERVHGQALTDGVHLQLPLDDLTGAMAPLGRGTVGAGSTARSLVDEAHNIGTEAMDAIQPLRGAGPQSQSLEQAVRSAGGIRGMGGELRDLGRKQSGTTGLVNNKSGKPLDLLAEDMHSRGFIPDSDPATLLEALRNGGGRNMFASDATEGSFQRGLEASMGDAPGAELIPKAVPFAEFQRLRRSAGELGAKVAERGSPTEAGVLNKIQELLTRRADDAANGITLSGDNITPEFLSQYNNARGMTKANAERYKGGNNITSILRKPAGQEYTLGGDEVTNKLWHGGSGLEDDVSRLKQVLTSDNHDPALNALRKFILTDAAGKTTAGGGLGAALPKYFESRMPGLQEALTPEQLNVLSSVAQDIRLSESAAAVPGLRGSDTQAKISRALDAGLLDSSLAKTLSKVLTFKGIGAEQARNKLAEVVMENKGQTIAQLMSDPKAAAKALENADFVRTLDGPKLKALRAVASRGVPVLASQ